MPQVTSPEPREPKPRITNAQKAAIATRTARGSNPKRPHTRAEDGWSQPTDLEIEEGAAHLAMSEMPKSKMMQKDWLEAHWRLCDTEGMPATTRCGACHVVRFGRPGNVACGACGSMEKWEQQIRRYEP